MESEQSLAAWSRRPSGAMAKLDGRPLLLLSPRDLLRAAREEGLCLVAFSAPCAAAVAGFSRAARDLGAPLLLARPSGATEEVGPEEAREDSAWVDVALRAADELHLLAPMALLKEPPRAGAPMPEEDRVFRELEAGFTGVALGVTNGDPKRVREAAVAAAQVGLLELGLELVPEGGSPALAAEALRELLDAGVLPSSVRLTGFEDRAGDLGEAARSLAVTTANESEPAALAKKGAQLLVATVPFLRAFRRAAPQAMRSQMLGWAREHGATTDQAVARHGRLLRELPEADQDRLEALCWFEGLELLERMGAAKTAERVAARIGSWLELED